MFSKIHLDSNKQVNATYDDIQSDIKNKKNFILDFSARWCRPCNKLYPSLQRLASEYENITFYKVDISENDESGISDEYNITSLPTILFFNKGQCLYIEKGVQPNAKNIIDSFTNYIYTIYNSNTDIPDTPDTSDSNQENDALKKIELSINIKNIMNF